MFFGLLGGGGPSIPNIKRPEEIQYQTMASNPGEFEQKLRQQALAQGPSASTMQQVGQAGQLAQNQYAQNMANMAQRGGISSGARERLGKAAGLQGMLGRQRALAGGEEQKLGLQSQFANREAQDRMGQNTFNLDQYKARLREYAGAQNARQQQELEKSKGLGNMLGTIGTIGGGVVGGIYGGPMGAAAGASIGGSVGKGIGS